MKNPETLEMTYNNMMENLPGLIPDGIIKADLKFLESKSLLKGSPKDDDSKDSPSLQFHIMESEYKVTLFNNSFAVWILPATEQMQTSTLIIIGQYKQKDNNNEIPQILVAFSATGMCNTSKIILKIVEHFLNEIKDNDASLASLSTKT